MRVRTAAAFLLITLLTLTTNAQSSAQFSGDETSERNSVTAAGGETEVRYYETNGAVTTSTRIPGGSAFTSTGGGAGGATPCGTFAWETFEDVASVDPVSSLPVTSVVATPHAFASSAWRYREIETSGVWSPETQGQLDRLDGVGAQFGLQLESALTIGESYYARNAPLLTAQRRFERACGLPPGFDGAGLALDAFGDVPRGFVDVPLTDPFWNPLSRLGILWGMIQLPSYRVVPPPEVATYGGFVLNMPAWLQIESAAWRPYFTDVDEYMGWTSQLGLFPSELRFEVVGPGGAIVPCAPAESAARDGAIPGVPDDLPRYYERGQLDMDCTWVPTEPGPVTVRARISYAVLLTVSGYSEWLSPYVWYSDPLTVPAAELRVRNVTPEGGIGQ